MNQRRITLVRAQCLVQLSLLQLSLLLLPACAGETATPSSGRSEAAPAGEPRVALPLAQAARAPVVQPRPRGEPQESEQLRAPLQVRWLQPTVVQPGALDLTLEVERLATVPPLVLRTVVPAGVRVVSAPDTAVLQSGAGRVRLTWRLWLDQVPADDFIAVVDGTTAASGVHAAVPFRFGRPEPKTRLEGRPLAAPGKRLHAVPLR